MYGFRNLTAALVLLICAPLALAGGDHAHQHDDDHGRAQQPQGDGDDGHMGHAHGGWTAPAKMAQRPNPVAASEASIERGQRIFDTTCATCHGQRGRGDGPAAAALDPKPADLVVMAPQHTDGDFAWRIATGRGAMPAWQNVLSEEQIWDVVNYLKALPTLVAAKAHDETPPGHESESDHGHSDHGHGHD